MIEKTVMSLGVAYRVADVAEAEGKKLKTESLFWPVHDELEDEDYDSALRCAKETGVPVSDYLNKILDERRNSRYR